MTVITLESLVVFMFATPLYTGAHSNLIIKHCFRVNFHTALAQSSGCGKALKKAPFTSSSQFLNVVTLAGEPTAGNTLYKYPKYSLNGLIDIKRHIQFITRKKIKPNILNREMKK